MEKNIIKLLLNNKNMKNGFTSQRPRKLTRAAVRSLDG